MSDIKQYLNVLKEKEFPFVLISLFLLISPGFLVIFHFFHSEFMSMETLKLVFLSISVICPSVFAFWLLVSSEMYDEDSAEDRSFLSITASIAFSGIILLMCLAVSYLFNYSFKQFVSLSIVGTFFGIAFVYYLANKDRKKREIEKINLKKAEELESENGKAE